MAKTKKEDAPEKSLTEIEAEKKAEEKNKELEKRRKAMAEEAKLRKERDGLKRSEETERRIELIKEIRVALNECLAEVGKAEGKMDNDLDGSIKKVKDLVEKL